MDQRKGKNILKYFLYCNNKNKKYSKIFWSPETQLKVFENMKRKNSTKDVDILKNKIDL